MNTRKDISKRNVIRKFKKKVWEQSEELIGHPSDIWRRDEHGNVINWQEYGNTSDIYGWKIIYVNPIESGGTHTIENMRAVHIETKEQDLK